MHLLAFTVFLRQCSKDMFKFFGTKAALMHNHVPLDDTLAYTATDPDQTVESHPKETIKRIK